MTYPGEPRRDLTPDQEIAEAEAESRFVGNYVPGSGPRPARLMLIGEAPGAEEDEQGIPFAGLAGAILDQTLRRNGILRESVYVTNLYKRRPSEDNDDPSPEQIQEGLAELLPEIQEVDPEVIVCLGEHASKAVWGACGEEFPGLGAAHGLGHNFVLGGYLRVLVAAYHPAAGLRVPWMAERFAWDISQLGGSLLRPAQGGSCPEAVDYRLTRAIEITAAQAGLDTEGTPEAPYCISISESENQGLVTRDLGNFSALPGTEFVIHNAPWDLPVLRAMCINLWALVEEFGCSILDPMILAYVLQDEPQGLKDLSYRYRGRVRKDFNETVRPYYLAALAGWFSRTADRLKMEVETIAEDWLRMNAVPGKKITKKLQAQCKKELSTLEVVQVYNKASRTCNDLAVGKPVDLQSRLESIPRLRGIDELPPKYDLSHVPEPEFIDYTCSDADDARVIGNILLARVKSESLEEVARQDHDYLPLLDKFRTVGLPIDLDACHDLKVQLEAEMLGRQEVIRELVKDSDLNVGSPDQIAVHLSRLIKAANLAMRRQRMTKTGARISTDEKAVMQIRGALKQASWGGWPGEAEARKSLSIFLDELQLWRGDSKLETAYVDKLINLTNPTTRRLYPDLTHTRVYSGRLAGFVLTLPRDTRIRSLVKAGPGKKIVTVDLSQIEPRTMAHESQDPELCRIYREGRDLYAESAAAIMNRPLKEVSKGTSIRQAFKTIDLAMLYLISSYGLYEALLLAAEDESIEFGNQVLDWGPSGVADIRSKWLGVFGGIEPYNEEVWRKARQQGYVSDMWGRRRFAPNIYLTPEPHRSDWVNKMLDGLRQAAERQMANLRIQGGAGGIKKRGCIAAWKNVILPLQRSGIYCEPILDIHDELLLEVDEDWAEVVALQVKECMELDSEWFRVPIVAEAGVGDTWADAK